MKPRLSLAAALAVLLLFLPPLRAAEAASGGSAPGAALAATVSQVTGVAISPLLGASAVGAYRYFKAPAAQRAALPWYAQMKFWLPALLLVLLVAGKDTFGTMIPGPLKKPLDALEAMENKVSGLVMAGAMVPLTVNALSKLLAGGHEATTAHLFLPAGLATLPLAALDWHWALNLLMIPLGVAIYLVVWVTAHAVNVLILLSPFSTVDAALKVFRTGVLSLLTLTAWINPWVGALLSLAIVALACLLAGRAYRLMIYGSVFCWDFFTRRHARYQVLAEGNRLFTARRVGRAPARSYGRLYLTAENKLVFKYRPCPGRAQRTEEIPQDGLAVGRGLFYPVVFGHDAAADRTRTLLLLPPRYKGHEELFARAYRISGVTDAGLRKAWAWLREMLGFGPKKTAPAPAPAAA